MASVMEVSTHIIKKSATPISNLKLQKLLYYVQGWSLAIYDKPAFNDRIEAWVHGPVVPNAFQAYRHFRWNPIEIGDANTYITEQEMKHIEAVLHVYGDLSATQLESMSHEESPWQDARKGFDPRDLCNVVITHEAMKSFFRARLNA